MERKAYPTDVNDEEWAFVAPYLTLMTEDAPQREHSLREVFNGCAMDDSLWGSMAADAP
jgi:transposase